MKTKPFLTRFGGIFGTLGFNDKSLFKKVLGCSPFWNYKQTNAKYAVSTGVYTSDKISKLKTIDKIDLKTNVIDGSIVNGYRQTILYSLVINKPAG